jgi:hypothetical protein
MIKDLIKDLSYGYVTLEQGLMRAKLIAFELENNQFKEWINNELRGYPKDINKVPSYRVFSCEIVAVIEYIGGTRLIPCDLTSLDEGLEVSIYKVIANQSIPTLEENLKDRKDEQFGYEEFPAHLVSLIRNMTNNESLVGVKRKIQFSQVSHIINQTKNKLIDTLLELNSAFPNLENNFQANSENKERAATIINNHIYGDNSSSNIGVGENFSQNVKNTYEQKIEKLISELEKIGVPNEGITEIREIISKETDKVSLSKKLITWVGKMTTKAIEKSIDVQIPILMEKINDFL